MASALCNKAVMVKATGVQARRGRVAARRAPAPVAAYGDDSKYFDLNDLENTVGSWDMYGQEDEKRYPGNQSKFFEQAAEPLSRRESMYSFLALSGLGSILVWGAKGSKDANLPITKGPQTKGENGKGGSKANKL